MSDNEVISVALGIGIIIGVCIGSVITGLSINDEDAVLDYRNKPLCVRMKPTDKEYSCYLLRKINIKTDSNKE